jgi:hypothetical protein
MRLPWLRRVSDYRPGFPPTDGKPSHDAIREWMSGFWKAMALVPSEWNALILDDRMRIVVEPSIGFIDLGPDNSLSWLTILRHTLTMRPR